MFKDLDMVIHTTTPRDLEFSSIGVGRWRSTRSREGRRCFKDLFDTMNGIGIGIEAFATVVLNQGSSRIVVVKSPTFNAMNGIGIEAIATFAFHQILSRIAVVKSPTFDAMNGIGIGTEAIATFAFHQILSRIANVKSPQRRTFLLIFGGSRRAHAGW
jgi:hypothetical protein